jgi:predicted AlkP superfamily phosphohydrolase/phosphomutase
MLVFTATDRLMHFLWDAYEDKNHKYHNLFLEHFRKIDRAIGEINAQLNDNDLLIMHSDHGFERLDNDIYISYLLAEEGFLQFKKDQEIALNNLCYGAKAFALDPARIYLNFKGKYPCGSVDVADAEDILCQLENLFHSLEVDGRKVIRDVYRKEQIYSGQCLENAPDLILVGTEGFNLKASVKADKLADKAIFTGKHTQDTAFLIVKGLSDSTIVPDAPVVWDIKMIAEKAKS